MYIPRNYFLNICHKLRFNGHVDLIYTEVWRGPARHGVSYLQETVYETRVYHIGDINRRESLGACGTSVYKRPRVNALHYGNVIARETARCGSLHLPICRRASYGRQWVATRTMARTRHRALRKTAANFAIDITYTGGIRGWSRGCRKMCVVCFMRKWQIRIVEETTYRAGALLSLQGAARLFYRPRKVYGTGNALCGIMLLISSLMRLASQR